ncbi:MAG TPA: hypothetical protein P5205_19505 [Candidatus Paceibacterota bacterium]|nr:hypothetical protein [Verrucomicrobiota bacterium]HSA12552.1 hypothetical protein [Candidatus Paceibacterota bacterium]
MRRRARKTDDWEYESEVHTASRWTMTHFNEGYWSIMGLLKTPSDGFTRDEVMGVAPKEEAERICEAHNAEVKELREIQAALLAVVRKLAKSYGPGGAVSERLWMEARAALNKATRVGRDA